MKKARALSVAVNVLCLAIVCSAIESPQHTVVHSESDFEIRLYRTSVWMSAPALDISFEKATWNGFHRYSIHFFFNYSTAHSNPMTIPVFPNLAGCSSSQKAPT